MKKQWGLRLVLMKVLVLMIVLVLIIAGCSNVNSTKKQESGASVISITDSSLKEIQQKINDHQEEINKKHSIAILSSGTGTGTIRLVIRSYGDFERVLSKSDIRGVKKTLFKKVGKEFPLEITTWECCKGTPNATGIVTDVDKDENRILVINEQEKNGNTNDPVANWVGLTEDGKVYVDGKKVPSVYDASLIGKKVSAWTTGFAHASYPGQVWALKVVLE
ncbi:hypothetical protein [Cohnella abietis]|uniref:DUF3221 domain-containing protein n=1 Tax=Cohnella abietis TaxID=2507935 RepID=A0A3T1DCI0_9BACL|nr:hypothetical protein [Cohnella abietis]BBI35807.1 hypothetical protein KCTCHS21_52060 [Cohnella abietis]